MQKKTQASKTDLLKYDLLYDYILVKAIRQESVNGLVKPEQYEDKPEFGEVVSTGEGRLLEDGTVIPTKVKKGDIIFFGKYSSVQTRSLGEDYYIIRDDDVMAVHRDA